MKSTRIEWIDISKGIAMFLIVSGHCADKGGSDSILLHFSMFGGVALFFLLSGMTFCWKDEGILGFDERPAAEFFGKLARGLIFPYFIWSFISILLFTFLGQTASSTLGTGEVRSEFCSNLLGMLYGNTASGYMRWNRPLWFLTCLVMVEIFMYGLLRLLTAFYRQQRISARGLHILYCIPIALSICWLIWGNIRGIQLCLPWEFETATCVLSFFEIGRLLRIFGRKVPGEREGLPAWLSGLLSFGCLILLWILLLNVEEADFRADIFSNPWGILPCAALGMMGVACLAKSVEGCLRIGRVFRNLLVYIGERTLAILVMHKFVITGCKVIISRFTANSLKMPCEQGYILLAIAVIEDFLMAAATIALCLVLESLLSLYCPQLFGKHRKEKRLH